MKSNSNRLSRLMVMMIALVTTTSAAWGQGGRDALGRLFQVIDPRVDAIIATPSLKRLSDQMSLTLEGMDRAALLMGSRPVDHAKSIAQIHSAVDDLGGAAALFFFDDDPTQPDIVILVPVTDHELFLEANFTPGDGGTWLHADGTALHAKAVGSWMALSTSGARLNDYNADGGAARLRSWLGDEGFRRLRDGDAFMASGTPHLATWIMTQLRRQGGASAMLPDIVAPLAEELWANIDGAALIVDCDPLATVLREVYRLKDDSEIHGRTESAQRSSSFTDLPQVNHVVAMRADLGSNVARHILIAAGRLMGVPFVEDAASMTRGVQAMLLSGGDPDPRRTLRHWAIVYETTDAAAWLESVRLSQSGDQGIGAEWVANDDGSARFRATVNPDPQMAIGVAAMQGLLLGTPWEGTFDQAGNRVMLGYSPDLYPIRTLRRRVTGELSPLDDDGVIQAMRGWLMDDPDIEAYVQPRQLSRMLRVIIAQAGGMVPGIKALELPEFDEGVPAIGFGLRQYDDRVESMVIIPAQVLAPIADRTISGALSPPGHRP